MAEGLYERYKEALKIGHVAVLRGRLEAAIEAYRAAAEIAPARALPHASLGGVYLRLGRIDDALVEYAAAVARAPEDEGSLLGQAEALTAAGRRPEAAADLDRVATTQEAAGRLPEAADTVRRALELDETQERTRRQRGLMRQVRLSAGDLAAERALGKALRIRHEPGPAAGETLTVGGRAAEAPAGAPAVSAAAESPAVPGAKLAPAAATTASRAAPADAVTGPFPRQIGLAERAGLAALESTELPPLAAARAPFPQPVAGEPAETEITAAAAGLDAASPGDGQMPVAVEIAVGSGADAVAAPVEGEAAGNGQAAIDGPAAEEEEASDRLPVGVAVEAGPSGDELLASADAIEGEGDDKRLVALLLDAVRAYAREGRFDAALDVAHRALKLDPSDVDLHLALVELYVSRGWRGVAAEKLLLLGRLADLDADGQTRQRVCAAASRAFPDDARLQAICS